MGHAASRSSNNKTRSRKSSSKRWGIQHQAAAWKDEDLGKKVAALLESNAHRRDAVILPTKSELIQSYQASRRSSLVPMATEPNKWVRLSFAGGEDHKNWVKEQKNSTQQGLQRRIGRTDGGDSSPDSSDSILFWNSNSKLSKSRPKIITNWLRDLEVLISDDDSEEKMNDDSSPVFKGKFASPEEEPWDDMMVSTDIPGVRSSECTHSNESKSDEVTMDVKNTKVSKTQIDSDLRVTLDLTKSEGVEPSYLMGAASSIKVLPTLPRKYRNDHSKTKVTSREKYHEPVKDSESCGSGISSSRRNSECSSSSESTGSNHVSNASSQKASEYSESDSSEIESDSSSEERFTHLRTQRLKSSSFTGFGRKNQRYSMRKYNDDYQKMKRTEWEHANFEKTLENSVGQPNRKRTKHRPSVHRHMFWSNQLHNFSFAPSSKQQFEIQRKSKYRSTNRSQKLTASPPSQYGFDPYTEIYHVPYSSHRWYQNDTRTTCHHSTSGIYYNRHLDSDSDISSLPDSDDSNGHTRKYAARLWQKNQMIVDSGHRLPPRSKPNFLVAERPPRRRHREDTGDTQRFTWNDDHAEDEYIYHQRRRNGIHAASFQSNFRKPQRPFSDRRQYQRNRRTLTRQDSIDDSSKQQRPEKTIATWKHLGELRQLSSKESLSGRFSRSLSKSTSLSEIDPALESKMNAMVKDLVYGSMSRKIQPNAPDEGPFKSSRPNQTSGHDSKKAIGAIHERVASALASVLMSKTLPRLKRDDKTSSVD